MELIQRVAERYLLSPVEKRLMDEASLRGKVVIVYGLKPVGAQDAKLYGDQKRAALMRLVDKGLLGISDITKERETSRGRTTTYTILVAIPTKA